MWNGRIVHPSPRFFETEISRSTSNASRTIFIRVREKSLSKDLLRFFSLFFLRAFECRSLLIDDRMGGFDGQVAVQVQRDAVLGHEVVGEQLALALDEHQAPLLEAEAERLEDLPGLVRHLDSRFFVLLYRSSRRSFGKEYSLPGCSPPCRCSPSWTPRSRCFPICRSAASSPRSPPPWPGRGWCPSWARSGWNSARWCSTTPSSARGRIRRGWTGGPIGARPRTRPTRLSRTLPCTSSLSSLSWWCPWTCSDRGSESRKRNEIWGQIFSPILCSATTIQIRKREEGAHRVEIGYDLVQESETFEALVVDALLAVEIGKVGHAGEQYADLGVALAVQIVVVPRPREEIGGHVGREDVVYEGAVPPFHVRSPFPLRHHLPPP